MTESKDLERLERDYLASKQQILEKPDLSFEKKQLQIKALGEEYHARRRELERSTS
jgi:lipase chaperone LimK